MSIFDPISKRRPYLLTLEGDGGEGGGEGSSAGHGDGGDGGSSYTPPATQEDLNRIIESRLAREREKFKGFDEIKAKAQQWDQLEAEKKTPSEKALEEATQRAAGETAAKYEQRIASTEIKAIAATLGFLDPTDALTVLGADVPKKDDDIDADELRKRVEKLAQDKPYLVKETPRKPRTRPTPRSGDQQDDTASKGGKGKAAAALRQLAKQR